MKTECALRRTKALVIIATLLLSLSSGAAHSEGEPFFPPAAVLPADCLGPWFFWICPNDPTFEFALEQEFWGHIGNGEYVELHDWSVKTAWYLLWVNGMSSNVRARIENFLAFSLVGKFVQGSIFNPFNLVKMLDALVFSEASILHNPNSPDALSLHNYLGAYLGFALGNTSAGNSHIDALYQITQTYGPIAGSEGEVVGAMALMLLIDPGRVDQGLATLDDCRTVACQHISSVVPYKEVGMQISIGEGYARLGDYQRMEEAFDKARAYAVAHSHPYPELIELQYNELTKAGGAIDQWLNSPGALGDIKLPLSPSAGAYACQTCHAAGFQTVNHY